MKNKKKVVLHSGLAATILLSPLTLTDHSAHAKDNYAQTTKDLNSGKNVNTDRILKDEENKKIEPLDNKRNKLTKSQAGETSSNQDKYTDKFKYEDGLYDFGQGSSLSGALKALDKEKDMPDKDIKTTKKDVSNSKENDLVNISVPGSDENSLGVGSGVAISKHVILTNDHVVRKDSKDGFTSHDAKDINLYPNRDGDKIPYQLKANKVKMLKSGDAALIYVDENLSKIMKIHDIASEDDINKEAENNDINLDGYPAAQTHNDKVEGGYSKEIGTPYDVKSKFIMNATSIHPIMYYKTYAESGMSGSPILNDKGELIGIHAGVLNKNNGNDADTGYGYALTKDLRKDIDDAIKDQDAETTPAKDEDTNKNDNDSSDAKSDKEKETSETSKNDDTSNESESNDTTEKDNENTDDTNTSDSDNKTNKDDESEDAEANVDDSEKDTTSDESTNDETSNDDKSDSDKDQSADDKQKEDDKDKEDTHKEDTNSEADKNDESDSKDNNKEDHPNESKDESSKDSDDSQTSSVKPSTSMGSVDKDKEEKTVAKNKEIQSNDTSSSDSKKENKDVDTKDNAKDDKKASSKDKNNSTSKSDNKKDKDTSSKSDKDENKSKDDQKPQKEKQTSETPNKDNDKPKSKAHTSNTATPKNTSTEPKQNTDEPTNHPQKERATSEEPMKEEPQDHQTFAGLPDTGSTAGNISELAIVLTATIGIGILAAQGVRKWRQNQKEDNE